jgi:riboflavin kinase/FMN adenylyltransferase
MKIHENLEQLPTFKNAVVTIGSFDGVHKGHKAIFNRINKIANKYNGDSVVVTFHPHPRSVIFPQDDSLKLLTLRDEKVEELKKLEIDHLVVVPFTVEFSQLQAEEYIENFIHKKFNPKCVVIGYDHKFGRNREGDVSLLREYGAYLGFEVIEIEKQSVEQISISSTKIRKAIQEGRITEANVLLGHNYGLIGKVEHGNKLGHQLGFPTANIQVENSSKLLPPIGIYSATVEYNNRIYGAMLYYGSKPSVEEAVVPLIEVNIFDFNEEIYDEEILIRFVSFIREDKTFEDLKKLRHQLRLDHTKAKNQLEELNALKVVKKKLTAVVLLNYNGKEHLVNYLPELLKQSKADDVSIHLVDNASTDDSVEWVRKNHPEVVVHCLNENHGFAKGYNLGLDKIQSDYYVILNNDVRVTDNWLPPIIQRLESDPLIAAVQPKIKSDKNPDYFEYAGAAGGGMDFLGYPFCRGRMFDTTEKDRGQYESPAPIFWASGAAMLIKSDLFYRAGGFDSLYFAHQEEIDLSWRLLRAGYKIYYEPNSTVYHLGGGTLSYEDEKKVFLNFRNNVITLIKNELGAKFAWLAITRIILDLIASLRFLLDKKPKAAIAVIKAYWFILKNIPKLYQKRKVSAKRVREIRGAKNTKSTVNDVRFNSSIIYHYFIRNKKTYSELNPK